MTVIRYGDLPHDTTPPATNKIATDGTTTSYSTLKELVDAGRPYATQAEAEAGVSTTTGMNPLRTAQAISTVGVGLFSPLAQRVPTGGTTNQVLGKVSNTDNDIAWQNAGAGDVLSVNNLSDLASASAARTNLGLAIGTDVQAYDADLAAIAANGVPGTAGLAILTKSLAADVRDYLDTPLYVATRTALKAVDTTKDTVAFLYEAGREGIFAWKAGDYSAQITADTQEGIFVKATAIASSAGAWVRSFAGPMIPEWFGAVGDDSTNDTTALSAAFAMSAYLRRDLRNALTGSAKTYKITSTVSVPSYTNVVFDNASVHYTGTAKAIQITGTTTMRLGFTLTGDNLKTISAITTANPASVTCVGHGRATGERVFLKVQTGMTELNNRMAVITVTDPDTFTLDGIDSSGYTTYTSGGTFNFLRLNHFGIYGRLTTTGPTVVTWIDSLDISGMNVSGFGEDGIRLDWTRLLRMDDVDVGDCAYAGILLLSAQSMRSSGNVVVHHIGPGSGGVYGFGFAFSRDLTLSTTDAPVPQRNHISSVYCYDIPYYVGFDMHSSDSMSVGHLKTRNVHFGCNIEAGSGGGSVGSVTNFSLGSFDLEGCDPTYHDIGPGFAIDAVSVSPGTEDNKGISIGSGVMKRHGAKSVAGFVTYLDSIGAAIFVNQVKGLSLGNIQMVDCYGRGFNFYDKVEGVSVSSVTCVDLAAVSTYQEMFKIGANALGAINDVIMTGSAGTVFVAASPNSGYGMKVGRNVVYSSGITKFDAASKAALDYTDTSAGTYTPTATIVLNADATPTFSVCRYIREKDTVWVSGAYTVDATATGDVQVGCSLPIASNFTSTADASGSFNFALTGYTSGSGGIFADATNDRVTFRHNSATTVSGTAYFTFSYGIK